MCSPRLSGHNNNIILVHVLSRHNNNNIIIIIILVQGTACNACLFVSLDSPVRKNLEKI